ncbi:MAG: hypothetical protein HOM52_17995 [Rhodospirillaceae bacterium]|jgi:hypothetical protein|nr:hypothetical protein [Rhodospirillaceae bacterium]
MPVKTYRFAWQSHGAHVRTRDTDLIATLGRFLDLEPVPEEVLPAGEADNLITIEETGGEFIIATHDWQLSAGNREQLLFAALEAIGQIFIYDFPGAIFHAGAFLAGKGAVAFFGAPQSGKSTLGFAAWRRGLALFGDDRIALMDEGRRVQAFPKCVKLRLPALGAHPPGAENLTSEMVVEADLGHEIRFILARTLPGFCPYDAVAGVGVVVELKRGVEGGATLAPLAAEDAVEAALQNVVSPEYEPMEIVRLMKRQAENGRLFRLTVGPGGTEHALDLLLEV